jgi:hypothetical protein
MRRKTKTITMTKGDDDAFIIETVRTSTTKWEPGSNDQVIAVMQGHIKDLQRRLKKAEFQRDDFKAQMLGRKRPSP